MIYACCGERRRDAVRAHPSLNGIDFLEVLDGEAPAGSPRQRTLLVRLLKPAPGLGSVNVLVEGGERVTPVRVLWAATAAAAAAPLVSAAEQSWLALLPEPDRVLVVRTDSAGDHSTYTLRLVAAAGDPSHPPGFDPPLVAVEFSFKVECPTDLDCLAPAACPAPAVAEPAISYLAKDYASFRRLMLDRMAQLAPDWRERGAADLGVTLVELLAYVADHLSYRQDAVATEAYLGTARLRTSARRHARLVDYRMHDGSNARAWVQVAVSADVTGLEAGTQILSRLPGLGPRIASPEVEPGPYGRALALRPVVFETMCEADLFKDHGEIPFHAWGERECCLPRGAVRATLRGHLPNLRPGAVLVLEQVRDPGTGRPEDADPTRRHPVRLVEEVDKSSVDGAP
jgi:hypothetical protein